MTIKKEIHKSRLTFIRQTKTTVSKTGYKERYALFRCDCGKEKEVSIRAFKRGKTKSCGCYMREICSKNGKVNSYKHGLKKHPIYKVWQCMKSRCYYKKHRAYKNYGGRGIQICEEWKNDVSKFYNFCIRNGWQKGLQIDRIDNNGNYEPSNCRFVTPAKNIRNSRSAKLSEDQVRQIRNSDLGNLELSQMFGVGRNYIAALKRNIGWRGVR